MTTFNLLSLHVWLVLQRIKSEDPTDAKLFRQALYTQYFYRDSERRVRQTVPVRGVFSTRADVWIGIKEGTARACLAR